MISPPRKYKIRKFKTQKIHITKNTTLTTKFQVPGRNKRGTGQFCRFFLLPAHLEHQLEVVKISFLRLEELLDQLLPLPLLHRHLHWKREANKQNKIQNIKPPKSQKQKMEVWKSKKTEKAQQRSQKTQYIFKVPDTCCVINKHVLLQFY